MLWRNARDVSYAELLNKLQNQLLICKVLLTLQSKAFSMVKTFPFFQTLTKALKGKHIEFADFCMLNSKLTAEMN